MNGKRAFEFLNKIGFERVSGSQEEALAAKMIYDEIESIGGKAEIEEYDVNSQEIKVAKLEVLKPNYKEYQVTGFGNSGSTPEEGLIAGFYYYECDSIVDKENAKGKIVLVNGRLTRPIYKSIIEAGAIGFISFNGDLNDPNVQYWLGWLATDGYISHSENRVTLSLSIKDIDVIEKFRDFVSPNLTIHHSIHHNKFEMVFVSFRNKEIVQFLSELGFNNNKTFEFVPNFKITWDYIRGVFEGDGYIREKEINITGASKEHITLIYEFVKQEGIDCLLKQKTTPKNTIMYDFEIYKKAEISKFVDKIYANADIFMDRKYCKARAASNSCWKTLKFGEPALGIPSQASLEEGVTT